MVSVCVVEAEAERVLLLMILNTSMFQLIKNTVSPVVSSHFILKLEYSYNNAKSAAT